MSKGMAAEPKQGSGAGLGWWARLMLWVLVIVFGVLYLGSVRRSATEGETGTPVSSPQVQAPAQVESPIPAQPEPSSGSASTIGIAVPEVSVQAVTVPDAARSQAPVQAVESAAFAHSLMDPQPQTSGGGDQATAPPVRSGAAPQVSGVNRMTEGATPGAPGTAQSGSTPGAGLPDPAAAVPSATLAPVENPPVLSQPAVAPLPAPAKTRESNGAQTPQADPLTEQRLRVMAEYEAMRRAAEDQMRRRWDQIQVQGGMPGPYTHPAYGYGAGGYHQR